MCKLSLNIHIPSFSFSLNHLGHSGGNWEELEFDQVNTHSHKCVICPALTRMYDVLSVCNFKEHWKEVQYINTNNCCFTVTLGSQVIIHNVKTWKIVYFCTILTSCRILNACRRSQFTPVTTTNATVFIYLNLWKVSSVIQNYIQTGNASVMRTTNRRIKSPGSVFVILFLFTSK